MFKKNPVKVPVSCQARQFVNGLGIRLTEFRRAVNDKLDGRRNKQFARVMIPGDKGVALATLEVYK